MSTKVLVIATTRLGYEGITSVIMNYYRNINLDKIKYDFILGSGAMDWVINEIKDKGGDIYNIPIRNKNPLKYLFKLVRIIKKNKYKIIHVHGNSSTIYLEMLAAKLSNVPIRIAHSHNSTCNHKFIHYLLKKPLNKIITNPIACSKLAGNWLYNKEYTIINNGIDIEKFIYNEKIRNEYRKKFDIENRFVIGHIGHFSYQKNHEFLLNIFKEIYKKEPSAILILIGDGKLRKEIEDQIENLKIEKNVILLGKRDDIFNIIQAMDVFLFPSRFEGLPVSLVEVQAAGIQCIVSDAITKECNITGKVKYISLKKDKVYWAEEVVKLNKYYIRNDVKDKLLKSNFNIKNEVKKLEEIYLSNKYII